MSTSSFSFLQSPVSVVRYEREAQVRWGLLHGTSIAELAGQYDSTGDFMRLAGEDIRRTLNEPVGIELTAVKLLSPVTERQQFICQGINYMSHIKESAMSKLPFNTIFTKASSCITSSDADIVRPSHVTMLDYEAELGLVLGTDIHSPVTVGPNDLHRYVAGIVLVNDVSARDVQLPQGQFYKGKSYRTFGPVGPSLCLLPASQVLQMLNVRLTLKVNGQTRQDFYARDMIFKPHETITELSGMQTLYAGDLIATGTAGGVAAKAPGKLTMTLARILLTEQKKFEIFVKKGPQNPLYLKPGDRVEFSGHTDDGLLDLGKQTNLIKVD